MTPRASACAVGLAASLAALIVPGGASAAAQAASSGARPVVVASKPFGESYLLAEMFAQLLEARGYRVVRRPGLGATEVAFQALRTGAIDVYPEYTGTGLLAILHQPALADPREVYGRVSREFLARFGLRWLPPLGFENTYAVAIRRAAAERLRLVTLSDLARASPRLTAGFTPDFVGRADGLPGLEAVYGMRFAAVRSLLPAVKYQAIAAGKVDVIDGYSTDGLLARYDLVALDDDRRLFPPYEAAALVGAALQRDAPGAVLALTELSGRIGAARMRRLNQRVEADGQSVSDVAASALRDLGLTTAASRAPVASASGTVGRRQPLWPYLVAQRATLLRLTLRHLVLVVVSLGIAIALALPAGLLLERTARRAEAAIRLVGLIQTVPGIALLAFMIPLLGIGVTPALVALSLYSLYPIVRNTYTGVRGADPAAVGAATASGMTPRQVLRYVRLPLAAPVIMAGVRTAAVIDVGTATLAAFIGAGGLGDPIVSGLALSDVRMILSGAIPAALLALFVDLALGACERLVTPGGVG